MTGKGLKLKDNPDWNKAYGYLAKLRKLWGDDPAGLQCIAELEAALRKREKMMKERVKR